jgi:REP element-mobilizing transposase RayT
MPNHVHVLIWPQENTYSIESITKTIKGRMAKRFIRLCKESGNEGIGRLGPYKVVERAAEQYRIWQKGGGFDRNLWNSQAIHQSIEYIESNPVRKKLVKRPEEYPWSSAYARQNKNGVIPDRFAMPVKMENPQFQRLG